MAIRFSCVDVPEQINYKRKVSTWIKQSVAEETKSIGDISIILCSDDYILETNRQYLQHDYFTDIITFDYSENENLSGDLLISIHTVKNNSTTYEVSFHDELRRVIIHGVLHLCGYKDKNKKDAKLMREKENYYLAKYDI